MSRCLLVYRSFANVKSNFRNITLWGKYKKRLFGVKKPQKLHFEGKHQTNYIWSKTPKKLHFWA